LEHGLCRPLLLHFFRTDSVGTLFQHLCLKFSSAFDGQLVGQPNGNFTVRQLVENGVAALKILLPGRRLPNGVAPVSYGLATTPVLSRSFLVSRPVTRSPGATSRKCPTDGVIC
jgi:hypothetical protein